MQDGIELAIEKPVFDRLTPLGSCRPEFLLEARSRLTGEIRRFIVHALEETSVELRIPKLAARRSLEQIAPVLSITPKDVEDEQIWRLIVEAFYRS